MGHSPTPRKGDEVRLINNKLVTGILIKTDGDGNAQVRWHKPTTAPPMVLYTDLEKVRGYRDAYVTRSVKR